MKPQPSLHHPKYRPDVDGLRAVAILSVVIFHAFPDHLTGGFIGVDIFFVISGYLISTIIFESLERGGFSFQTFYARRIMRIFPALAVVLFASLTFGWMVLLADELNQLAWQAVAGAGFFSNFVLWGEFGYFDTSAETKPLLHLWSLSIEEQYYIVWPFVVWLLWRWKRSLPWVIAGLVLGSFLLNLAMMMRDPVGAFYLPLARFWELLCGAILAWFATRGADLGKYPFVRYLMQTPPRWLPHVASIAGVLLIGHCMVAIDKEASFPGYWALLPVVGAMLLIAAGTSAVVNRYLLSTRVMVWFGLISFPLYLWHWPLLSFAHIVHADVPPVTVKVVLVMLSVLLAWLTYRFIERPIRSSAGQRGRIVSSLGASMVAIGLFGFALSRTDFTATHTIQTVAIARPDFALGSSLKWYHGKDDWLFLGNAYERTVQKLKLAIKPSEKDVQAQFDTLAELSAAAAPNGIALAMLVGPNKETIYPEFLPDVVVPSAQSYSNLVLDRLRDVPDLIIYDPTDDLRRLKETEGLLYFRTDTHWNSKGAFLTLAGLFRTLELPQPDVQFKPGAPKRGDLIDIAQLEDFPLHPGDTWEAEFPSPQAWSAVPSSAPSDPAFLGEVIENHNPLSEKRIWVVGDSFAEALRPFLNSTFREVRYVGHWRDNLAKLPALLKETEEKPDLILIVMVERSF